MSLLLVYSSNSINLSQKLLISSKFLGIIYTHNNHHSRPSLSPSIPQSSIFSLLNSHHSISIFNYPNPNFNKPILLSSSSSLPNKNRMATCVHTSRAEPSQVCDSDRSQSDHHRYRYLNYCRPNYSNVISCAPISQVSREPANPRKSADEPKQEEGDDFLWSKMVEEAKSDVEQEPILSNFYYNLILSHKSFEKALANHLAAKLSFSSLNSNTLFDLFLSVLVESKEIMEFVKADLRAVRERDPACISYVQCFLNFKGFLACQAHRIAHKLWTQGRKILALLIQNRVSEVFAVDIHPGAKIGRGILFDHATGVVIGETAVIGNDVSILHGVTLGGTGKTCGDRHPKIGDGVLIGAGTCVLGNVKIGDGAKIGAGSVVLKEVPARTTAVGNPARLIGGKENPFRLDKIPSLTMDHTSHITQWSDYVI